MKEEVNLWGRDGGKVEVKDGGQDERPLAPVGLSSANLPERSRRHSQARYLLFCLWTDVRVLFMSSTSQHLSYLLPSDFIPLFPRNIRP